MYTIVWSIQHSDLVTHWPVRPNRIRVKFSIQAVSTLTLGRVEPSNGAIQPSIYGNLPLDLYFWGLTTWRISPQLHVFKMFRGNVKSTYINIFQSNSFQNIVVLSKYFDILCIPDNKFSSVLTLPMLRLLPSTAQGRKIFENHINPVMLVFTG